MKISALVLAGGKSSRMNGNNKALLPYKDKNFIEVIIDTLKDFNNIYISVDNINRYENLKYTLIEDEYKEIGPLGGIYSALKKIDSDYIFVVACDMPKVTKDFIKYLMRNLKAEDNCLVMKDSKGRIYPLGAIYSKRCLPVIEEMIKNKDYKLVNLVEKLQGRTLSLEDSIAFEEDLININNPKEYEALKNALT